MNKECDDLLTAELKSERGPSYHLFYTLLMGSAIIKIHRKINKGLSMTKNEIIEYVERWIERNAHEDDKVGAIYNEATHNKFLVSSAMARRIGDNFVQIGLCSE